MGYWVIGVARVVAFVVFGVPVSADSASGEVAIGVAKVAAAVPCPFASDTHVSDPAYPAPSAGCTAAAVHSSLDHARQRPC